MRHVTYILFREGSSDDSLKAPLEKLLIRYGADETFGTVDNRPGSTLEKLQSVSERASEFDIVFVHRDADCNDPSARQKEIIDAAQDSGISAIVVGVIPVHETEAWALAEPALLSRLLNCEDQALSRLCPPLGRIEETKRPKELLEKIVRELSPQSGRRKRSALAFPTIRRRAIASLDPTGPVSGLQSFKQLHTDIARALALTSNDDYWTNQQP